jgi:hypothetical protein
MTKKARPTTKKTTMTKKAHSMKKTKATMTKKGRSITKKATTKVVRKKTPYTMSMFPKKAPQTLNRQNVKWNLHEPKGLQRKTLYTKQKKCILVPPKTLKQKKDPKNYKFPICSKLASPTSTPQFNCRGILAANRRARLSKYPDVEKLTRKLLDAWTCTKKAAKAKAKKTIKPKKKTTIKPKKKTIKPKKKTTKTVKRTTK